MIESATTKQENNTNILETLSSVNFEEEEKNILASIKCDKTGQNSRKMEQFAHHSSMSTIDAYFTSSLPSAIENMKNTDLNNNRNDYDNENCNSNDDMAISFGEIYKKEKSQDGIFSMDASNYDLEFNLGGFDLFTPSILLLVDEIAALECDILSRQADGVAQVIRNLRRCVWCSVMLCDFISCGLLHMITYNVMTTICLQILELDPIFFSFLLNFCDPKLNTIESN